MIWRYKEGGEEVKQELFGIAIGVFCLAGDLVRREMAVLYSIPHR